MIKEKTINKKQTYFNMINTAVTGKSRGGYDATLKTISLQGFKTLKELKEKLNEALNNKNILETHDFENINAILTEVEKVKTIEIEGKMYKNIETFMLKAGKFKKDDIQYLEKTLFNF